MVAEDFATQRWDDHHKCRQLAITSPAGRPSGELKTLDEIACMEKLGYPRQIATLQRESGSPGT